jgi:predicted RNase H-like nuclease
VFRVPCRRAIYAETYEKAKSNNLKLTGKSVPVFAWGIVPKIREVDTLLLSDPTARAIIKEVHPELCFWALAGGRPMQYNKKTKEGYNERLQVLRLYHPQTDAIVSHALENYRRKEVKEDDILDALVTAITAFGGLNSIPDPPELDDRGLPMQMVYRSFSGG